MLGSMSRRRLCGPAKSSVRKSGQAQCDLWFPETKIPVDGHLVMLPVLVMVASFSRFITARMIPTRTPGDLLVGMWSLLSASLALFRNG